MHDTPSHDTPSHDTRSLLDILTEGLDEEIAEDADRRRQARIANCGKPFRWYNPVSHKLLFAFAFCKDHTCEKCNRRRGSEEQARIEYALTQYDTVFAFSDLTDSQWPKFASVLKRNGITTNLYRRLPQDDRQLSGFFVGTFGNDDFEILDTMSTIEQFGKRTISILADDDWYDLARKRPGKRTSGKLGALPEVEPTGPELTSCRIECIRGDSVTSDDQLACIKIANDILGDQTPQDKLDVERLIKDWADGFETALRRKGYATHRLKMWRKLDLTQLGIDDEINGETVAEQTVAEPATDDDLIAIHPKTDIDVKPIPHAVTIAHETLYPRDTVQI